VRLLGAALSFAACLMLSSGTRGQAKPAVVSSVTARGHSLFEQSAARILENDFANENISFLLLDAQSGALIASRWPDANQPIPLGSLAKPFAALAYAQHHQYRYPIYTCYGKASGCWQARPHGRLNISEALGYSCNSYFRDLTSALTGVQIQDVAAEFGLERPDSRLTGTPLMGLGEKWPISPLHMARAYLELVRRRNEPGVVEILAGLADSARWGTGSGAARVLKRSNLLVKTGTAVCVHTPRAPGDGFVVVITPSAEPDLLLMVRVHGVPGSRAAFTAGRMLARLEP
jgi:Penicillin binding protein transpeptidase domain